MLNVNTEVMDAIAEDSKSLFGAYKESFNVLKGYVDAAGDNVVVDTVVDNAREAEKAFNNDVLTAFDAFRKGVAVYITNNEEWEKRIKGIEPIDTRAAASIDMSNKLQPFDPN